jgi:lipoyl(octanoyl) transferase
MNSCRLLLDPPGPGAWNMAVDELLLDAAAAHEQACWRFYGWSEPVLSLGYFQDCAGRSGHAPSGRCPVVRRLTGGGAIVHDAELTYSVAVPSRHPLAHRRDLLYQTVHNCLVGALADLGVTANVLLSHRERSPQSSEPFLCFQRRTAGDVLLGETKIAGSAQRRRRGAVLQHGSLLLRRSPAAPELPGLEDLSGKDGLGQRLAELWLDKLLPHLADKWSLEPLSAAEVDQATRLAESRYGCATWTEINARR